MTSQSTEIIPGFRETELEADGFRIRALRAGEGDPVVVLDTLSWGITALHLALAQKFQVAVLQLPGMGAGESNQSPRSVKNLAATMARAASLLKFQAAVPAQGGDGGDPADSGKFTLIGTSLAANAALWQAIQAPDQVEALVLIGPTILRPTGLIPSGDRAELGRSLLAHPENQESLASIDAALAGREHGLAGRTSDGGLERETQDRLGEVQCPTLTVFGLHDKLTSPQAGGIYREKIPNSHLSFVYDTGHAIVLERPESLAALVVDYVMRQETFIVSQDAGVIHP